MAIAVKASGISGIFWTFLVTIILPLTEEVVFRELLLDQALSKGSSEPQQGESTSPGKYFRIVKAITTTSVVFGLIHGRWSLGWSNVSIIVATSLLGSIFGLLKVTTGNLWAPVAAHAINNIITTAFLRSDTFVSLEQKVIEVAWRNKGALLLL